MPPKIAGFYWDESKGKYFKIQPDHLAPAGSKYSKQAIKKEKEEKRTQQEAERHRKWLDSWPHIKRRKHVPLDSYVIDRSLGGFGAVNFQDSSLWAGGLSVNSVGVSENRGCVCGEQGPSPQCVEGITSLVWDHCEKRLLVDMKYHLYHKPNSNFDGNNRLKRLSDGNGSIDEVVPLTVSLSTAGSGSICMSSSGNVLATDPHTIKFFKRGYELSSDEGMLGICSLGRNSNMNYYYINSLAARPESDFDAAIGTDQSICFVSGATYTDGPQIGHQNLASNTLSVGWLDRNVIVGGCRDGTVNLLDVRTAGLAHRLQHPSSIAQVHVLSSSQLLVAGIENQMHLYDLRCTPPVSPQQCHVNGKMRDCSQPYVSYPTYYNQFDCGIPTAVSLKLNVAAAATSRGSVKLFDLMHGNEIKPPRRVIQATQEPRSLVRSMCFLDYPVEVEGKSRGPSLFIGRKHTIDEWTWD